MSTTRIAVVIPVSSRADALDEIVQSLRAAFQDVSSEFSIALIIDGDLPERSAEAAALVAAHPDVQLVQLARNFGEGGALSAGIRAVDADVIVTHPAYFQVELKIIPKLLAAIDDGADVAFAARGRDGESWFSRFQRWVFNALMRRATWVEFRDISCGVRAARREVLAELDQTDSFHRFLPLHAVAHGYDVREVDAEVHEKSPRTRVYSPGTYLRRLLDITGVFFLIRFLFKPLRFFGLVGIALFSAGAAIGVYLCAIKFFAGEAISQNPFLLLSVLLVSIGVQLLALGLLGELITFSHAGKARPYRVRSISRKQPDSPLNPESSPQPVDENLRS